MLAAASLASAQSFTYYISGDEPSAWGKILSSIGLADSAGGPVDVYVAPNGSNPAPGPAWDALIARGGLAVLEGESDLAASFGFRATAKKVLVSSVLDHRRPKLAIVWERALAVPVWEMPEGAQVFARDRSTGAPLVAGLKKGAGGLLWLAVPPGAEGRERFPYLLHALVDLGLKVPFRSGRVWAFFDSSYRLRVDLDYFAERWRRAGIGALHVSAWHHWEPDAARDAWLDRLIEACHRRAIQVYAWLELPHVSEQFWNDHPEWREKTALLQDAHLDWRKLMNLANRDCFREVARGVRSLAGRFDWDGINLAELYFESLEGASNPSRFTPFNPDVRREFEQAHGVDPVRLLANQAPLEKAPPEKGALVDFLDFRAKLTERMQSEWIAELDQIRRTQPHLDLALTHVDDRFDTRMREMIGADAARLLPLLDRHDFTFLIEDPATVWHLGPQRYQEIAKRYAPLTRHKEKLAIDINIVERYQDVYPTRQQVGIELFDLVNTAARVFPRVALYFENSIQPEDVALLGSVAAAVTRVERLPDRLVVDSARGAGVFWGREAKVDGRPWPATDGAIVWLPSGAHSIETSDVMPPIRLVDFNGDLKTAAVIERGIEFSYISSARALAVIDRTPSRIEIDGAPAAPRMLGSGQRRVLFLPRGQHLVTLVLE